MGVGPCAWCGGPFRPGSGGQIHATRFNPGEREGVQIVYQFCTDACMRSWLDPALREDRRADHQ